MMHRFNVVIVARRRGTVAKNARRSIGSGITGSYNTPLYIDRKIERRD
jgi:hypothetical protein